MYKILYDLDHKGKMNYVSKIKAKLFSFGFGFVLLNQGVEDVDLHIILKERLIWWQDCRNGIIILTAVIYFPFTVNRVFHRVLEYIYR